MTYSIVARDPDTGELGVGDIAQRGLFPNDPALLEALAPLGTPPPKPKE